MILTRRQAEAVYSAMCALNNIGSRLHARDVGYTPDGFAIQVHETDQKTIAVATGTQRLETHDSQAAFAAMYGLDG